MSLDSLANDLGLPPIDQVAWVVDDLDRALETFGPLFGPFSKLESPLVGTNYRGRRADVTLKIAFGRSGPLEIELIEVVSGESPHRETLEKQGEGIHHVRFRVDELDRDQRRLEKMGFEVIWSHSFPQADIKWAYLEGPRDRGGVLVELYQNPNA